MGKISGAIYPTYESGELREFEFLLFFPLLSTLLQPYNYRYEYPDFL